MSFACQRDSFLRSLETEIVECSPAKDCSLKIVCKDSVLFPEGGGQNSDIGRVGGVAVTSVARRLDSAVIKLATCDATLFPVGAKVVQEVDWPTRWDHMQQHSGQHLLSALLETHFGLATTSWWMAKGEAAISSVEVDRAEPASGEELSAVEELCNQAIRDETPVHVKLLNKADPKLTEAHTRGLPDDVSGPLRVIVMGELDSNLCCGTHVSNLAQLGAIKVLHSEKAKKGRIVIHFIVGDRLNRYVGSLHERESRLTKLLKGGPADHVSLVEGSLRNLKCAEKALSITLKELAALKANEINAQSSSIHCVLEHRKEAGSDYMNLLLAQIKDKSLLVCLVTGDDKSGSCQMVLSGPEAALQSYGKKVSDMFAGKGGGKGTRFNAKLTSLKRWKEVEILLSQYRKEE